MQKEIDLELMCELTDDDIQVRSQQLGAAVLEQDRVGDNKASAMKAYSEELKEIAQRMRIISRAIRDRVEQRLVRCVVEFHVPSPSFKRVTRLDTGEFLKDEPMTLEERQRHLFEPVPSTEMYDGKEKGEKGERAEV